MLGLFGLGGLGSIVCSMGLGEKKLTITVSKPGTAMARITIITIVRIRVRHFSAARVYCGRPVNEELGGIVVAERPQRFSVITKIGRAFKGILVRGITAMKTTMATEILCG